MVLNPPKMRDPGAAIPASEVAAEHATRDVPVVSPSQAAGEIREMLQRRLYEHAHEIVVCERGRLAGLINIEALLAADPATRAAELMDADPPVVAPGTDQEIAAWKAVTHRESSLAVVGPDREFIGLIPPRQLLAVLLWEHEEDVARLSGYLRDTSAARAATEESIGRRFRHRAPWLVVGLLGAFLAALVVERFEGLIEKHVVLAFFSPGVVYLADAVGTQTEAIIIRGLSVGVRVRTIVVRELVTGLLIGIALAAIFVPLAALAIGDLRVAVGIALALFAACSIATFVAMTLPWAFQRTGIDPAFGSGPLATVIQDLLSVLLYFAITAAILG